MRKLLDIKQNEWVKVEGKPSEQISHKIKYFSEDDKYDAVVLHVGTNNLVSKKPEEVASKMVLSGQ